MTNWLKISSESLVKSMYDSGYPTAILSLVGIVGIVLCHAIQGYVGFYASQFLTLLTYQFAGGLIFGWFLYGAAFIADCTHLGRNNSFGLGVTLGYLLGTIYILTILL